MTTAQLSADEAKGIMHPGEVYPPDQATSTPYMVVQEKGGWKRVALPTTANTDAYTTENVTKLNDLFQKNLGRPLDMTDAQGLSFWLGQAQTQGWDSVEQGIKNSEEGKNVALGKVGYTPKAVTAPEATPAADEGLGLGGDLRNQLISTLLGQTTQQADYSNVDNMMSYSNLARQRQAEDTMQGLNETYGSENMLNTNKFNDLGRALAGLDLNAAAERSTDMGNIYNQNLTTKQNALSSLLGLSEADINRSMTDKSNQDQFIAQGLGNIDPVTGKFVWTNFGGNGTGVAGLQQMQADLERTWANEDWTKSSDLSQNLYDSYLKSLKQKAGSTGLGSLIGAGAGAYLGGVPGAEVGAKVGGAAGDWLTTMFGG